MSIIRKIIQHLYKNLHRETDYLKTSRNWSSGTQIKNSVQHNLNIGFMDL
jgi:hypothetical protein